MNKEHPAASGLHHCHAHASDATHMTDPVCGMSVDPHIAAGNTAHAGKTYYFCSQHCLAPFKTDLAEYL